MPAIHGYRLVRENEHFSNSVTVFAVYGFIGKTDVCLCGLSKQRKASCEENSNRNKVE